jgi:hypothetical protein
MIRFDQALIQGLAGWREPLVLLQTIPGIDLMGAAMLLVEKPAVSSCSCRASAASGPRDALHFGFRGT